MILNKFFDSKQDWLPYIVIGLLVFVLKYPQLAVLHSQVQVVDFLGIKYGFSAWGLGFFVCILIFLQCIWVNILFNKIKFMQNRTQIFALCYLILLAQNPLWLGWGWWHVALFLWLWAIDSWLKIGENTENTPPIFAVGMKMGATLLFYPSAVVVVPLGVLALFFLNVFSVRRLFVFAFGCFTPVYFFGIFSYLSNNFPQFWAYIQAKWRLGSIVLAGAQATEKKVLFVSLLLMVLGVFLLNGVMQIKTGLVRAYSSFFTWSLLIITALSLFYADIFESFVFILPFGAYFLACVLRATTPRWFLHDGLVLLLLGAVFYLQFYI